MSMQKSRLVIAVISLAIVASSVLPYAGRAQEGDLTSECKDRLIRAHEYIEKNQATITFTGAIAYLQAMAGDACGFDITGTRPNTVHLAALENFVGQWVTGAPETPQGGGQSGDLNKLFATSGGLVPCTVPGAGAGTITGSVLGVLVGQWSAAGEWKGLVEGNQEVAEVSGDAGLVGGVQGGDVGTIFVAAVPLPAFGSSGAWCAEIKTGVSVEGGCIWLIVWTHCYARQEVEAKLVPCEASASQNFLVEGFVNIGHDYTIANNECPS